LIQVGDEESAAKHPMLAVTSSLKRRAISLPLPVWMSMGELVEVSIAFGDVSSFPSIGIGMDIGMSRGVTEVIVLVRGVPR
jgi:hypothetical protein